MKHLLILASMAALVSCSRTITVVSTTADKVWDCQEVTVLSNQEVSAVLTMLPGPCEV